jgi:O-antigen/teichoic acid export membrane protein
MIEAESAPPPSAPLGRLVRVGLGWSFLNNLLVRIGTVLAGIVLARILTPADYGVLAVALVAFEALLSINELGVSLAIVRWPGDVRRIAPTVMTLSIIGSVGFYAIAFVAAPSFAAALNAPAATGVLRLLCVAVMLDGITAVPAGLLNRGFQQDRRMLADLASLVVFSGVAIFLASRGLGAWSIAWGRVAGNVVSAVAVTLLASVRFRPGFDGAAARELLAFGMPAAGSSLLVFAMLNVDYVVVGGLLGPVALGFYMLAFNLSSWPVTMFSMAVRRVALAGFSQLQKDPTALRFGFARSFGLLMAAAIPVSALLSGFALPLVRFVYGAKWEPAASALRWLAILGALRVALELSYDFLIAAGRSRMTLWLQAGWLAALLPTVVAGAKLGGIQGVAIAHVAVAGLLITPAFLYALARLGVSVTDLARNCWRPLAAGLIVFATATLAQQLLHGDLHQLAVGGAMSAALIAPLLLPMRRPPPPRGRRVRRRRSARRMSSRPRPHRRGRHERRLHDRHGLPR